MEIVPSLWVPGPAFHDPLCEKLISLSLSLTVTHHHCHMSHHHTPSKEAFLLPSLNSPFLAGEHHCHIPTSSLLLPSLHSFSSHTTSSSPVCFAGLNQSQATWLITPRTGHRIQLRSHEHEAKEISASHLYETHRVASLHHCRSTMLIAINLLFTRHQATKPFSKGPLHEQPVLRGCQCPDGVVVSPRDI